MAQEVDLGTAARVGFFGHPRGLATLFMTEMWERFSYYGMRALLVLFMTDAVRGGLGLTDKVATAIYGLYTAGVYLSALPGGWIADRFLGASDVAAASGPTRATCSSRRVRPRLSRATDDSKRGSMRLPSPSVCVNSGSR